MNWLDSIGVLSTKTIKRLYYYSVTVFDLYSNLGVIEVVLKKLF